MVTTVSSRDAVLAGVGRSDFSIMAARRNSLFLISAGPAQRQKGDPRYFVQATIFIAIVMIVLDSGIASGKGLLMWSVESGYSMVLTIESAGA